MSMTPLGPKQLAKEFGTPGAAMSVDPTPERVQDDWWCDGSWHRGWDHGWYGYTPVSWNGWWAGRGWDDDDSWSATSWQSSSTDTCRWERKDPTIHRMTSHLQSDKSLSRDSLDVLLEKAYEGYSDESDPDAAPRSEGKESRGSLKSLDSATTLELGSMSRESLEDEVPDTIVDKGIELDDGLADKLQKITVQEDGSALPTTVQEGEKQVPQNTVQEAEKQVPQSTVQESEKQVPQSTVQEAEKQVPQSTVQEAEKQVPQSTVQEAEKQVPQSTVQEAEKQVPQSTVQEAEKQVPQSTVQEPEKQVPQSTVQEPQKQVPQSNPPVQESPQQVQMQSGADTAAGGGQMVKQEPECDDWRRDKYGKLLGPAALYARFYRTGRSLSERSKRCKEIYSWRTLRALRLELGDDLANDLYARHKELDSRLTGKLLRPHPNFSKDMTLLKVFDTIKDIADKKFTNSADMQIEANDVDENDVHKAMDALLDEEMPESSLQPGKPENSDNKKPKPKPKKEKTWREKAQEADKRANKEIIDYAGFKQILSSPAAGVASNMKAAILADVDPAKIHLEQVKYKVATAIGQKVSEVKMEPLFRELEAALQKFKTVSEPVRAAERKVAASEKPPKATAKAKAKGTAAK
ncbi:FAM120B [Symbiodinium sp. CCMP2592]|nr:FAM120B [Symbiodinium sp. CCMP2592]